MLISVPRFAGSAGPVFSVEAYPRIGEWFASIAFVSSNAFAVLENAEFSSVLPQCPELFLPVGAANTCLSFDPPSNDPKSGKKNGMVLVALAPSYDQKIEFVVNQAANATVYVRQGRIVSCLLFALVGALLKWNQVAGLPSLLMTLCA